MSQSIPLQLRCNAGALAVSPSNEHSELVLHPVALDRGAALLQALEGFDDSFAAALDVQRLDHWLSRTASP